MYIRKAMRTNKRPNQVIQIENEKKREKKESIIIFLQFSCWYLYKMTHRTASMGKGMVHFIFQVVKRKIQYLSAI